MQTSPLQAQDFQNLLAKNIRAARERLGISQMKLAERAELSVSFMNDVERARRWVGAKALARLGDVLHLRPNQFFLDDWDSSTDTHAMLSEMQRELREAVGSDIERVVMRYASQRRAESGSTKKKNQRRPHPSARS